MGGPLDPFQNMNVRDKRLVPVPIIPKDPEEMARDQYLKGIERER